MKIGEHRIRLNPLAKINLEKQYTLRLWDYDIPVVSEGKSYVGFIKRALAEFRRQYPNIQVKLYLLDLLTGEECLKQGLLKNEAPDIYCSFYNIPEINFGRQIPVGPFLKDIEQSRYPQSLKDLLSFKHVFYSFPRWTSTRIWVGNRAMMEKLGIDWRLIQQQGWCWSSLQSVSENLPQNVQLWAGVPFGCEYSRYLQKIKKFYPTKASRYLKEFDKIKDTMDLEKNFDKNAIARFVNGQTVFIASVRPAVFLQLQKNLAARNDRIKIEPIALPAPHVLISEEFQFVENGIINIYRNRYSKGDDHIAAAVKLGQFLSTYRNIGSWREMGVIPTGAWGKTSTDLENVMNNLLRRSILLKESGY